MIDRYPSGDAQDSLEMLKLELERHLRTISCPTHGKTPRRVTVTGTSAYDMRFNVEGCCDELADIMLESIGNVSQNV